MSESQNNAVSSTQHTQNQSHSQEHQSVPVQIEEPLSEPIQIKPEQPQKQQFIRSDPEEAEKLKSQGNDLFRSQEYFKAISLYQQSLQYLSQDQANKRCVLYSNISICLSKQADYKDMVQYCKKAIACDPNYLKAQLNLAIAYEKIDNPEQALQQYKKVHQLNPKDAATVLKIKELQKKVEELNQKRKAEVIDGLKKIGNSVLGYFGMSLDNFKLNQGQNGGYSVSFKN